MHSGNNIYCKQTHEIPFWKRADNSVYWSSSLDSPAYAVYFYLALSKLQVSP